MIRRLFLAAFNRHNCADYWILSDHPTLRCSHIPIICARCGNQPPKDRP